MNPTDLMLWALAVILAAIALAIVVGVAVGIARTFKPKIHDSPDRKIL